MFKNACFCSQEGQIRDAVRASILAAHAKRKRDAAVMNDIGGIKDDRVPEKPESQVHFLADMAQKLVVRQAGKQNNSRSPPILKAVIAQLTTYPGYSQKSVARRMIDWWKEGVQPGATVPGFETMRSKVRKWVKLLQSGGLNDVDVSSAAQQLGTTDSDIPAMYQSQPQIVGQHVIHQMGQPILATAERRLEPGDHLLQIPLQQIHHHPEQPQAHMHGGMQGVQGMQGGMQAQQSAYNRVSTCKYILTACLTSYVLRVQPFPPMNIVFLPPEHTQYVCT
jgi:hypothetical protein